MSGGVDSTVAAYLAKKAGYDCIGATMRLFDKNEAGDAESAARRLCIPHHALDFSESFREQVIGNFVTAYERGDTPNPCIDCNRCMKFGRLLSTAEELSCDYVVTGHYARVKRENGRYYLMKAAHAEKDQSYVLYFLSQEQLGRTLFPLGELQKSEVRRIAEEQGFLNAEKKESQDICFAMDGDYAKTIETLTGKSYPPGDFTDKEGRVLGRHRGLIRYTIGQRKGLGLALPEPLYVCEKRVKDNTVILGKNEDLYTKSFYVNNLNWIAFEKPPKVLEIKAKIRYRQTEQPAAVYMTRDGAARVEFEQAQRAVTRGQAAVFYDGDTVVGGGTITSA